MLASAVTALLLVGTSAQDPAHGWMAYAVGKIPSSAQRITKLQMTWKVGAAAKRSSAFYSPWFGMDPADNLNLLQPVNPWEGSSWSMYTEYYQWSPSRNSNSRAYSVKAGQTLHGSIIYNKASDSYDLTQTIVETGQTSSQTVKAQNGKKFDIPYVVYEKTWTCSDYPPDGKVTFKDIVVECDGTDCTKEVQWSAKVEDKNCNMAAHIDSAKNEISITWDTSATSKYDNYTDAQLVALNAHGWGARFAQKFTTDSSWEAWKASYGRNYATSQEEDFRHSVFTKNMATAAAQNEMQEFATFGANEWSDWTEEEFSTLLGYVAEAEAENIPEAPKITATAIPTSKDWTGTATTSVKNQGSCGSCWAFSATEQIESDYMLQHGKKLVLAPQELVDCKADKSQRNGCKGGNTGAAYKVIEALGGIEAEADYKYTHKNGQCRFSPSKEKVKVTSYSQVGKMDETEMKKYVGTTGPLSVCGDASSWHNYKSGIMTKCGTKSDHCFQIVGYGEAKGMSYWKVRNSWGTGFGEDGFLRIEIGKNLCGIAHNPTNVVTTSADESIIV